MSTFEYDVVLVPEGRVEAAAHHTSRLFMPHNPHFVLDPVVGPFPHVSLYMASFMGADLSSVLSRVEKFVQRRPPVELTAEQYHGSGGYVGVKYLPGDDILSVQDRVVADVAQLRDGMRAGDERRFATASGVALKNLQRFGYLKLGSLFFPHLTFTRLKDEMAPTPDVELPHHTTFSGRFDRLGLFRTGENGTCLEPVGVFRFAA